MSSVNNNQEIQKVYQFLASFKQKGEDWAEIADNEYGNGDGTVIKSEFKKFVNGAWNGEEKPTDDIINKFWKTFDTNKTGKDSSTKRSNNGLLDSKELNNLNNKIELYVQADEYMSTVKVPNCIATFGGRLVNEWKNCFRNELMNLIETKSDKFLDDEEVLAKLQNKATATCISEGYKAQLKTGLLAGLEYDVDNDKTLNSIIANCIETINAETTEDEICTAVKNAIDKYFSGEYDSVNGGALNDYQIAKVKKACTDQLATKRANYQGYEEQFDAALTSFIEKLVSSGKTYDEIMNNINDLIQGFDTTELDATIRREKNTKTITSIVDEMSIESLTQALTAKGMNENTAKLIATNIKYNASEAFNTILAEIIEKHAGDETIDKASVKDEILNTIVTKQTSFSRSSSSNSTVAELNEIYDSTVKGNTDQTVLVNAALSYCKALISKNSKYLDVIKEVFDSNYAEKIKSLDPYTLLEQMDTLKLKALELEQTLEKEISDTQKLVNVKSASKEIANALPNIETAKLGIITSGKSKIHTDFKINATGEIEFEKDETKTVYNSLKSEIYTQLTSTASGKKAVEDIGGQQNLNKLIQAAWIMTYNSFNATETHSTANFIVEVFNNLQKILTSLQNNPEYINVYTKHTAYFDSNLTTGLVHYNTKTTLSDDETIIYSGGTKLDESGVVHLANNADDPDYQATMGQLLNRLIDKYPSLPQTFVTSVLREAQQKAIEICQGNIDDCPFGTARGGEITNWGNDDRKGDSYKIHMDELVQLTLYCFDKLLYAKLVS